MSTDTTAPEFKDPRESRLPMWAQRQLHAERAKSESLRRQLAEMSHEDSRVITNPYAMPGYEKSIGLGDRTEVRFITDPSMPQHGVDVSLRDGHVKVTTSVGALAIVPRSSNLIDIRVVDLHTGR